MRLWFLHPWALLVSGRNGLWSSCGHMCQEKHYRSPIRECSVGLTSLNRENFVSKDSNFYPVILAGGRGTRFWPLSRRRRAKQLLALDGKQTMIQQTVARLLPLASAKRFWVVTNEDLK